jgi:hypothetical protein
MTVENTEDETANSALLRGKGMPKLLTFVKSVNDSNVVANFLSNFDFVQGVGTGCGWSKSVKNQSINNLHLIAISH